PLAVLRAVQVDNGAATLSLGYLDGTRRAVHTVQFGQPMQRKGFAVLRDHLGPGWREEGEPDSIRSAATAPFWCWLLVALVTAGGYLAARQELGGNAPRGGRGRAFGAMAGAMGPTLILIIGVVLTGACVLWAILAHVFGPPAKVTLTRDDEPAG